MNLNLQSDNFFFRFKEILSKVKLFHKVISFTSKLITFYTEVFIMGFATQRPTICCAEYQYVCEIEPYVKFTFPQLLFVFSILFYFKTSFDIILSISIQLGQDNCLFEHCET